MNREVDPWPIVLGAAAMVLVLILFAAAGRGGLGLLIVVGILVIWSVVERVRPGRTVELSEVAHFTSDCDQVWGLIEPPEKAPLLDPSIRRGYRVPGSPDGIGARHALEMGNGVVTVLEVVELTAGRRAVVRIVSPPSDVPSTVSFELTPVDDGCLYRHHVKLEFPRGKRLRRGYERTWRAATNEMFGRIRKVLSQSSAPPPTWPPPPP